MRPHKTYTGPALFSYGFRPLFLLAGSFAAGIVPLWMVVWTGRVALAGPFSPTDWHIHELLFGYASAVVAGFLFTAIPNWTGRMPTRGWPLMALAALWMMGRLAVAGFLGLGPMAIMALDCAFLLMIGAMVTVEIVVGRNWSNLRVVLPVVLYLAANITFHIEAMQVGTAEYGRRLGFAMLVLLIGLIGGRIIPSFTRNWLAKNRAGQMPAPFGRYDAASLVITLGALLLWVALPEERLTGIALILAGVVQALRLARWRGWRVWRSALLLMLHLAYAFIPAGLLALGLAVLGVLPVAMGLHLLGIGAIGGMTLAVMMRASLGHTGRDLQAGPALTLAFGCVAMAAVVRVAVSAEPGLWVAATLWTCGFAMFVARLAPALTLPSRARRAPNPQPR